MVCELEADTPEGERLGEGAARNHFTAPLRNGRIVSFKSRSVIGPR